MDKSVRVKNFGVKAMKNTLGKGAMDFDTLIVTISSNDADCFKESLKLLRILAGL